MKKIIGFAILLFASIGILSAQNDCMGPYPTNKGTTLVHKSYAADSTLNYTITYIVMDSHEGPEMKNVEIGFTIVDADNKMVDQGTMMVRCDGGTFFLSMQNTIASPDVVDFLSEDTELLADFLDYPDTFSSPGPFDNTFAMESGTMSVRSKKDKKNLASSREYNRRYVKNEKITTPAGTFDASKITYDFEVTKNKKTTHYKGTEWYAAGAGIVRSEKADSEGQLQSYVELCELDAK